MPFRIGINMAGAISAGAYTAGVLDFLTEAIDAWYAAQSAAKSAGAPVPTHDISLDVFSGASAGGMCAAISSVMLQQQFDHIPDATTRPLLPASTNRFYESWVNQIDIRELLGTDDLNTGDLDPAYTPSDDPAPPIVSLLDSTIINTIATYALTPATNPITRPWVAPNLTLFLSLTNLRGVPYSLNGAAPGSIEETTAFYGDRIRFETTRNPTPLTQTALHKTAIHSIDLTQPGPAGGWDLLQTAAMATGAFPVFLAPRILTRRFGDYCPPVWESVTSALTGTPPPIAPTFPKDLADPFQTVNVDGGVTNNDPFNYAHDYLASLTPARPGLKNPRDPVQADRAVITVAPFPTIEPYKTKFDPIASRGILSALPALFSALIAQSRFFGESLSELMHGEIFSRFVIAPSDPEALHRFHTNPTHKGKLPPPALECAALGAFGGFFERGFRAHDYALGRRNCQKFLETSFLLPINNPLHAEALAKLTPDARAQVLKKYGRKAPGNYNQSHAPHQHADTNVIPDPADATKADPPPPRPDSIWLPIIPLCSESVTTPIGPIPPSQITADSLDLIVDLILTRAQALLSAALRDRSALLRGFLWPGRLLFQYFGKAPLRKALIAQLGDSYRPKT